jgi:hypothetical protein
VSPYYGHQSPIYLADVRNLGLDNTRLVACVATYPPDNAGVHYQLWARSLELAV